MFSFLRKKSLFKRDVPRVALLGAVLVLLTGFLLVSCNEPNALLDNAQKPTITGQPAASTNWDVSANASKTLTVTASVTDGGTLSYQWYTNGTSDTSGSIAITTEGTNATLTLNKAGYTTDGTYYFYVIVTNTNDSVSGTKTATTVSSVAEVTVSGNSGSAPEVVIPANLNGHFQSELSFFEGWGCSDDAFAVNTTAKTFYYYFDSTLENYWRGNIVNISEDNSGDGGEPAIMIIQITGSHDSSGFMTLPTTGKYFAYAYKSLAGDIVSSAAAYKSSGSNTGLDTIAEAIAEYTKANGYFDYYGTYTRRTVTAANLVGLQGIWSGDEDEGMEDYIISIQGTAYIEFIDDYEDPNRTFDGETSSDDMLTALGEIVDCVTDDGGQSGVLYIKITFYGTYSPYSVGKFIAVGWKKTNTSVDFATSSLDYDTVALAKVAYGNASAFVDNNYSTFTKE